jgi:predicted nucleic acid-binding protein
VFASLTDAFGLRVDADAADDKFIVAAVEGEASYIVSGDLHLKDIGEYQGIKIISPTEFLRIISERG